MLTAMLQHMDSSSTSTYASPLSSTWQQQLLLCADDRLPYDRDVAAAFAPPPPPSAPARQHQHRAASSAQRRVAKPRRPRPSRRLPTTYISADPAEFRRMVQQVTGADDLLHPPPTYPEEETDQLRLPCHYPALAPVSGAEAPLLLPTLDTSAFLLGRDRSHSEAPQCDGSASAAGLLPLDNNTSAGSAGSCDFPTLESWDLL